MKCNTTERPQSNSLMTSSSDYRELMQSVLVKAPCCTASQARMKVASDARFGISISERENDSDPWEGKYSSKVRGTYR